MKKILEGPKFLPISGGKPKNVIIMLHGVGANGDDLIGIADVISHDFPDTQFFAPNAPYPYAGMGGFQWFEYWNSSREQIIDGVEKAAEKVSEFAAQILDELELAPENLLLMGFSQGAMVAIHAGLTMQDNCSGVLAFSGGLLKVEISSFEARSNPPMCLIHGEQDEVVPVQMSEGSAQILANLNVPVEFHKVKDLGHSIDMNGIEIAKGFIHKTWG